MGLVMCNFLAFTDTHMDIFFKLLEILAQQKGVRDLDVGVKPSRKSLRPWRGVGGSGGVGGGRRLSLGVWTGNT